MNISTEKMKKRKDFIAWASLGGMILPAILTMCGIWIREGWLLDGTIHRDFFPSLLIVAVMSPGVGLLCLPVVVRCVHRKNLRLALPMIYGFTIMPMLVVITMNPGNFDFRVYAIVAIVSVWLLSILCKIIIPDTVFLYDRQCPLCDYDLRGDPDNGCPECGWNRKP